MCVCVLCVFFYYVCVLFRKIVIKEDDGLQENRPALFNNTDLDFTRHPTEDSFLCVDVADFRHQIETKHVNCKLSIFAFQKYLLCRQVLLSVFVVFTIVIMLLMAKMMLYT